VSEDQEVTFYCQTLSRYVILLFVVFILSKSLDKLCVYFWTILGTILAYGTNIVIELQMLQLYFQLKTAQHWGLKMFLVLFEIKYFSWHMYSLI
jgi:hypothetical protein